ncbi:MAG TPA: hypothetical protein VMV92_03570 [Streptosporangiaceae bacterium]|nr:hypothetical protein [Streptosporangiaceae bacterium]
MSRQIAFGYQEPSIVALEERMHRLEMRVAALSDVLLLLVGVLADTPVPPPAEPQVAAAVRQANELLKPGGQPAAGG